jgi:ParB-like chromosome segregation protein Spo0J
MTVDHDIVADAAAVFTRLTDLGEEDRMDTINAIRAALHDHSPMREEPVDCVLWVRAAEITANDYNPNVVAAPEMELLEHSITADGYTQPIVTWKPDHTGRHEVVDGFHRHRVGHDCPTVAGRLHGRLPITVIRSARTSRDDRMAATIRHNRARGLHTVDGMADIVLELSRNGKGDEWIARELGMQPDEVVRLRQTTGLAEAFADQEFSEAWEVDPWARDGDRGGAPPAHGEAATGTEPLW